MCDEHYSGRGTEIQRRECAWHLRKNANCLNKIVRSDRAAGGTGKLGQVMKRYKDTCAL